MLNRLICLFLIGTGSLVLSGQNRGGEPPADSPQTLSRIAFGSCGHQDRPQPIWGPILATRPDLFVFLGDNIYADTSDMAVMRAKYAKLAAVPGFAALRKAVPIIATWDDHDLGKNDGGADFAKREESQTEFLNFFEVAKDAPRRTRKGVYEAWTFGPKDRRVQVILLDTRYHRSELKVEDGTGGRTKKYIGNNEPGATVLGEEQWAWLATKLKEPADLRIIGSSIQVLSEDHVFEKWMNFPKERERLFQLLKDTKAEGVVFLSGDRHLGEISVMDANLGYPIVDVTASGFNQANTTWRKAEVNRHRFAAMPWENHFGLVEIQWEAKGGPLVSLQLRNEEGTITANYRIPLKNLRYKIEPKDVAVGAGAIGPIEAAKRKGEAVTVEMEVQSSGQTRDKSRIFLNSMAEFRDPANFTVVLDAKAFEESWKTEGIEDFRKGLVGKKIRASGTITEFQSRPQLELNDPKNLKILPSP